MQTRTYLLIHHYASLGYDDSDVAGMAEVSRRSVTRAVGSKRSRAGRHRCGAVIDSLARFCHYCGMQNDGEEGQ